MTPDLTRYAGFRCFKCGWTGDGIKLVREVYQCEYNEAHDFILRAYGLPANAGSNLVKKAQKRNPKSKTESKKTYPTLRAALDETASWMDGMSLTNVWQIENRIAISRWDGGGEKTIRPFHRVKEGWQSGSGPKPWPLYGRTGNPTFVVEGEKCVDALLGVGIDAVSSLHGSSSAKSADWTPLEGKNVVISPDNDKPGRKYAADVKRILTGRAKSIRILELPVGEGEDVYDFIAVWAMVHPASIREHLLELARQEKA